METSQLQAGSFYGSIKRKWIGLEKSIDKTVKKFNEEKIPTPFPARILGPSALRQTFFRQQDAFKYCRSKARDLHVFAYESKTFDNTSSSGQRMYLAASYPAFWHYYKQLKKNLRHHYEVIPEGAASKLYFDLEFSVAHNVAADGNKMVDTLIKFVCLCLETEFLVSCTRADVLDLDASTDTKFSRHLIFVLKKAVFQDNVHAGNFVRYIFSQVTARVYPHLLKKASSKVSINQESASLNTDHCNTVSECVPGGTRQVNVDMIIAETLSTPTNGTSAHTSDACPSDSIEQESLGTELAGRLENVSAVTEELKEGNNKNGSVKSTDKEASNDGGGVCDMRSKEMTMESGNGLDIDPKYDQVIQQMGTNDLQQLFVQNKHGDTVLFCDLGVYTKNRNFRLYLSTKLGKDNPLRLAAANQYNPLGSCSDESFFNASLVANTQYDRFVKVLSFDKTSKLPGYSRKVKDKLASENSLEGYSMSPYPEVDEYIRSLITQHGAKGVIRHWIYFPQGEMLIYEIAHFRFCHNIGRQHRSNNIMYVADLHRGVFYQKCHDPDCYQKNFKSEEWDLPRYVLPASYFDDLECDFDLEMDNDLEMDDDELLNQTLELEQSLIENKGKQLNSYKDDSSNK